MTRTYDSGPQCRTCGKYAINVDHDGPTARARNIEQWAAPTSSMFGQDYYTWAGVIYHPFDPIGEPAREPARSDYERGYQAGYHTGMRRAEQRAADIGKEPDDLTRVT